MKMRKYLYLTASDILKFNPVFKAYYGKKWVGGFPHRKAIIYFCFSIKNA